MRGRQNEKIPGASDIQADADPEQNLGDLREALRIFGDSVHRASERSDFFWRRQHNAIMARLNQPESKFHSRASLFWAPAALVLMLCLFFFAENGKAPTPDFAGGSDEMLLISVERALSRDCPEALAAAGPLYDKKADPLSTK